LEVSTLVLVIRANVLVVVVYILGEDTKVVETLVSLEELVRYNVEIIE
jgi:hypothetical protein